MLRRKPAFAIFAVVTLAIGIGINTTVFSLMNALLLRPLPAPRSNELIRLYQKLPDGSLQQRFSYPDYQDFRDRNTSLSGVGAVALVPFRFETDSQSAQILGEAVSGNFFSVLNILPSIGRLLSSQDDRAGGDAAAVISYDAWRNRFLGDPNILQRAIRLNGNVYQIVGVMNPKFLGTFAGARIDAWVSLNSTSSMLGSKWQEDRTKLSVQVIARLNPGKSSDQAFTELNAISAHLEKPERFKGIQIAPATLLHGKLRKAASIFFVALVALMGLVLLIACSNLAGILLTKALERTREMAIRISLGADRGSLTAQLLSENLLLSFLGGVAGFLASNWLANLIVSLWPIPTVPVHFDLTPDWRIFTFAFGISLISGVIIGLTPILQTRRRDVVSMLKEDSGNSSQKRMRLKNALVVAQIGFSMLLLVCAGLFVRSWRNAQTLQPGFDYNNMLALDISLGSEDYSEAKGLNYYNQLLLRVSSLPGVVSTALSDLAPMDIATPRTQVKFEAIQPPPGQDAILISSNRVSSKYLRTTKVRLMKGRDFSDQDNENTAGVVIINETMARQYWHGEDAIGRTIRVGKDNKPATVIGIAKDVKYRTPGEEPTPHMYLSYRQFYGAGMTLLVRTTQAPKSMLKRVEQEMAALDKNVQGFFARSMEEHLAFSLLPAKIGGSLLGVFGLIALLLASIGIYAAISFHVAQRTREIGIRMAVGARPASILNAFVQQGLRLSFAGSVIGILLALLVTRFLATLLIGIGVYDPITFFAVPGILIFVSLIACGMPAYRASKLDPLRALRHE
jgi:macrolide transport system ATP-binding/permease protein